MTEPEVVESLLPPESAKPKPPRRPFIPPPWPVIVGCTLLGISAGRILLAAAFSNSPIIGPLGWIELARGAVVLSFLVVLVRWRWAWLGLLVAAALDVALTGYELWQFFEPMLTTTEDGVSEGIDDRALPWYLPGAILRLAFPIGAAIAFSHPLTRKYFDSERPRRDDVSATANPEPEPLDHAEIEVRFDDDETPGSSTSPEPRERHRTPPIVLITQIVLCLWAAAIALIAVKGIIDFQSDLNPFRDFPAGEDGQQPGVAIASFLAPYIATFVLLVIAIDLFRRRHDWARVAIATAALALAASQLVLFRGTFDLYNGYGAWLLVTFVLTMVSTLVFGSISALLLLGKSARTWCDR